MFKLKYSIQELKYELNLTALRVSPVQIMIITNQSLDDEKQMNRTSIDIWNFKGFYFQECVELQLDSSSFFSRFDRIKSILTTEDGKNIIAIEPVEQTQNIRQKIN